MPDEAHGAARAAVLSAPRRIEIQSLRLPDVSDDDGILEVEACGLCGTDYEQYTGSLGGVMGSRPIIPGHEIIGRIAALGPRAGQQWGVAEGDRVAVEPVIPCGTCAACLTGYYTRCARDTGYGLYQTTRRPPGLWGGYATHLYLHPRSVMHRVPDDIPAPLMTLFNPLSNAFRWVTEIPRVGPGSSVVIQGPGQRGLCAVVAAREAGASTIIVTGRDADAYRLGLAARLGATEIVPAGNGDPVRAVAEITGGQMADVVVDVSAGDPGAVTLATRMVRRGGEIVLAGLHRHQPTADFVPDEIVLNEIRMTGALSAGYTSVRKAIEVISRRKYPLDLLCTHSFALGDAERALLTLGREITAGDREAVHVTLTVTG